MTRALFRCDGAEVPREWRGAGFALDEAISIVGSKPNVAFSLQNIERHFLRSLDGVALDLARVAAFAFVADTSVSRGGDADWRSKDWIRELQLVVPVNEPELWQSEPVLHALRAVLEFASGDRWSFAFTKATQDAQWQLAFPGPPPDFGPEADRVVLFSGGADSLTATVEALDRLG